MRRYSILLALLFAAASCHSRDEGVIVVGSKKHPESQLLAEMMAQLIEEHTDLRVERRHGLSGMLAFNATVAGEIDAYPEYTGTGLIAVLQQPLGDARDQDAVYQRVQEGFGREYGLRWLKPFGFNNTYVLAVRPELGVETISELKEHEDDIRAGFQHDFMVRDDGYPGLAKHYGLRLANVGSLEHGIAYRALAEGKVDLVEAYATDGKLKKFDFTLLADDRKFFPPYYAAPVIREAVAEAYPEVVDAMNRLAGKLSESEVISLNYQVEEQPLAVAAIARRWLRDAGLVADAGPIKQSDAQMTWGELWLRIGEHLQLTLIATGAATVIGVGLGLLIVRFAWAPSWLVLGTAGVMQTIPSLALLAFMVPIFGIGTLPAIVALFAYALLPIIRNTYTGLNSVPAELVEAGRGMGMTRRQLLFGLELPLAVRTIMAGVRTALVINIGTATIAAFIDAGGLGVPIITGLQMNNTRLILWGAIPAALLALACDFLMARLEIWLEPRGLRIDT